MYRVIRVEAKEGYVLALAFEDGTQGEVCIADRLFGPVFEPLNDFDYFSQVSVDQYGAVRWPNDADLAPDALYQRIKSEST